MKRYTHIRARIAKARGVTSGTVRRWEKTGVLPPAVRFTDDPNAPRYFETDRLPRVRTADAPKKGPRNG